MTAPTICRPILFSFESGSLVKACLLRILDLWRRSRCGRLRREYDRASRIHSNGFRS